jgi:hypothetical protein
LLTAFGLSLFFAHENRLIVQAITQLISSARFMLPLCAMFIQCTGNPAYLEPIRNSMQKPVEGSPQNSMQRALYKGATDCSEHNRSPFTSFSQGATCSATAAS